MAPPISTTALVIQLTEEIMHNHQLDVLAIVLLYFQRNVRGQRSHHRHIRAVYERLSRIPDQVRHINRLVNVSDVACLDNLRMDQNAFGRLCLILR